MSEGGEVWARSAKALDAYEQWAAKNKTARSDEPEEGYKHMRWKPPLEWGEVVFRDTSITPWERPCEVLRWANGECVRRLLVPIQGYD